MISEHNENKNRQHSVYSRDDNTLIIFHEDLIKLLNSFNLNNINVFPRVRKPIIFISNNYINIGMFKTRKNIVYNIDNKMFENAIQICEQKWMYCDDLYKFITEELL